MSAIRAFDLRAWLIIAAFVVLNTVLLIVAAPGGHRETDTENYYAVAEGLLEHGDLVRSDDPGTRVRLAPGYALLLAAGDVAGGGDATIPVVLVQLLALLVTGLITRDIVTAWLGRYHNLALALVILNPNSLSMAQTLMPMTIYALALTASVWAALKYARAPNFGHALLTGLFLGVAILFRLDPRFLIILLPVALPLLAILDGRRAASWRTLSGGVAAAAFAIATISPWTAYVSRTGSDSRFSIAATAEYFLAANLGVLEKRLDPSLTPANAATAAIERGYDNPVDLRGANETYDEFLSRSDVTRQFFHLLSNYSTTLIARAAAVSQVTMFASGGASNIRRILGVSGDNSHELYVREGYGDRLSAWFAWASLSSPGSLALSIGAIGFAVTMRLLGLAGLFVLVMRRKWPILLIVSTIVLYSVLLVMFNGLSRYRVPIVPHLMILSVFGIDHLLRLWMRIRGKATA